MAASLALLWGSTRSHSELSTMPGLCSGCVPGQGQGYFLPPLSCHFLVLHHSLQAYPEEHACESQGSLSSALLLLRSHPIVCLSCGIVKQCKHASTESRKPPENTFFSRGAHSFPPCSFAGSSGQAVLILCTARRPRACQWTGVCGPSLLLPKLMVRESPREDLCIFTECQV